MHNAKNAKNYATFVEGFWSEFYDRGNFLKYSMSVLTYQISKQALLRPG